MLADRLRQMLLLVVAVLPRVATADDLQLHLAGTPLVEMTSPTACSGAKVVTVTIERPPPSRFVVIFTRTDPQKGVVQKELGFDPLVTLAVKRQIVLECADWTVTSWSEAVRDPSNFAIDFGWTLKVDAGHHASAGISDSGAATLKTLSVSAPNPVKVEFDVSDRKKPSALRSAFSIPSRSTLPLSGRSFGASPDAAMEELLGTVAEVIADRAKSRATSVLMDRLRDFVCDDLQVVTPRQDTGALAAMVCALSEDPSSQLCRVRVFARTCDAMTHLRLQDLLGAGATILSAVLSDLVGLVERGVANRIDWLLAHLSMPKEPREAISGLLDAVNESIGQMIAAKSLTGSLDAQALLLRLARVNWTAAGSAPEAKPVLQALDLAFAIMQQCHSSDSCDLRAIQEMLVSASDLFDLSKTDQEALLQAWPTLDRFIVRGVSVMFPASNASPSSQLEIVIDMIFDIMDRLMFVWDQKTAAVSPDYRQLQARFPTPHVKWLRLARSVLDGALNGDVQPVIAAAGELVEAVIAWLGSKGIQHAIEPALSIIERTGSPRLKQLGVSLRGDDGTNAATLVKRIATSLHQLSALEPSVSCLEKAPSDLRCHGLFLAAISEGNMSDFPGVKGVIDAINGNVATVGPAIRALRVDLTQFKQLEADLRQVGSDANVGIDVVHAAEGFRKVSKWIGAAGSYLATYLPANRVTADQARAQHEARKRAIESLIDASTDRHDREKQIIFSIGGTLGLHVGFQNIQATGETTPMPPQLSLPLGFAVERLPSRDGRLPGVHLQLSLIDVGQYLAYDRNGSLANVSWTSFFMVGLEAGILVGTPSINFLLGLDIRYSPTLFPADAPPGMHSDGSAGAIRFGLFAGAYVPLFDFN